MEQNQKTETIDNLGLSQKKLKELLEKKYELRKSPAINITQTKLKKFYSLKTFGCFDFQNFSNLYLENDGIKLQFITTSNSSYMRGSTKHVVHDLFALCAFYTKKDYGSSFIKQETLLDKITDFFIKAEIDFPEFPEFSSKYYCLSTQPEKFKLSIDKDITDLILENTNEISIEFQKGICLISSSHSVKKIDTNIDVIDFAFRLRKLIG